MADAHEVLLMLPSNVATEHESMIDTRVRYERFFRPRYRQPFRQLATIAHIIRTIRKFSPNVVHFQNGHLFFNLFLRWIKKFPLVITIHDPRQHLGDKESLITPQWLMDAGFRNADRAIVHGTELVSVVEGEIGIPKNRLHVIPHIAIGERKMKGVPSDDGQTVLFFGRIWEYKGLDYLIRAEPAVTARFPGVRFIVGGRGENFDRYTQLMVHPERFEVHNDWISDEERASMFSQASIVVLPYVEASQSGVIPIAYTYGKPVIATNIGGLPEMVEHGRTGLLVEPRDVDGLANSIVELLSNSDRRRQMGLAGKAKLDRECSASVVANQTLEVYAHAIRDRGHVLPKSIPTAEPLVKVSS